jgi:hypothetical protein
MTDQVGSAPRGAGPTTLRFRAEAARWFPRQRYRPISAARKVVSSPGIARSLSGRIMGTPVGHQ